MTARIDVSRAPTALPESAEVETRRYRVFLSYSHADSSWARWLMRRLESYAVPKRFQGRDAPIGRVGRRIAPVFRDRDELPTTSDLGETIRAALRESATLVVICSPASARSRWVHDEIVAFKRLHGERDVFAFIVAGEPKHQGTAEDCFSPALRREVDAAGELTGRPAEVVAADARAEADGRKLAFLRLVAGLLGVGFDELRQRELQRRNRRLMIVAAGSTAGMALTLGLAAIAWQARNDARRRQDQAEDVLAFMLGGFRDELKKLGQLPLLEKVGDKAMTYFDAADERDLTDTALARQAKALTQIGEVRMERKDARYAEAARTFFTAYQRAAALATRHPSNGDMLFERAQAEYWLGLVSWRRRDLRLAAEWLTRYRDSAVTLTALNPSKLDWQRELVAGHHNLAVLELEEGHLDAARAGFAAELATNERLLARNPADLQLRYRIADGNSWLGNVAERAGRLREGLDRYVAQTQGLEWLVAAEPENSRWRVAVAEAYGLQARLLAVLDRRPESLGQIRASRVVLDALLARDPTNRNWATRALVKGLKEAEFRLADGDTTTAARLVTEAIGAGEKLFEVESSDRTLREALVFASRLEAELRARAGAPNAAAAAAHALALAEPLMTENGSSETFAGSFARCCVTAAEIARQGGDAAEAERLLARAVAATAPFTKGSQYWAVLDPAARALAQLGREQESRVLRERLDAIGYRPLSAWPRPGP